MRIAIVSLIPWDFLHQRPQKFAEELAARGHLIYYIEPYEPGEGRIRRARALIPGLMAWRQVGAHIAVARPLLFPPHHHYVQQQRWNRALIPLVASQLRRLRLDFAIVLAPEYAPVIARLGIPYAYDHVDDTQFMAHVDTDRFLAAMHHLTAGSAFNVYVEEQLARDDAKGVYIPNGVDIDEFFPLDAPKHFDAVALANIGKWFDMDAILASEKQIVLVGPMDIDRGDNLERLLALSCKLGLARPAWCRRGLLIAAVLPVPPLLLTSHNTVAGIAALSLLLPANWWGRLLAARLPGEDRAAYAWTIGSAARVGLLQVAGLAIGLLGLLRAPIAWALLEATVLAIPRIRDRMRTDFALARRWSAGAIGRDALALVLGGIALACCWLALIGTLAPETNGNAVRQRTPTALSFATHGCIAVDYPDLNLPAVTPIGGLIHALVLTLGTVQGAKLLNLLIGLCCAGTVAGLGCRVGGRASGPAAISFFTMPPVVVQSQADLLDSFLTLYVVATALAILVPQRPHWRGELREGGCIGLALTVKAHFGEVAIGLATVLRGRGRRVMALVLVLTLTAGAIAARWLLRTYLVAGELPGRTLPAQALRRRKRSPSKCWRGTATRARCPMPCSGRSPRPSSVSSTASYPRPGAVRQLHQLLPAGRHPIARAGRIALAHAGHAGRGAPGARRMVVRGPVSALRLALPRAPQRGGHGGNGGRGTVAHHSRAAPGLRRPASPDHRGERRGANARAEYSYRHAVPAGDGNGTFLYCLVQ